MSDIRLSKKHGVNPSILLCPICGKEYGLALLGKIDKEDSEAPRQLIGNDLCNDCKAKVNDGKIAIIEMANNTDDRTGRYIWVPKEVINVELKHPMAFMINDEFEKLFND